MTLSWLGKALENKNRCSETESGRRYRIVDSEEKGRIEFETGYGSLTMPEFKLIFEEEDNE